MLDLSHIPLVDHHAHPLRRDQLIGEAATFRRFFSESTDPRMAEHLGSTVFYRRAIRDLAVLLDCEPSEDAVLAARTKVSPEDYTRQCFEAAQISCCCSTRDSTRRRTPISMQCNTWPT